MIQQLPIKHVLFARSTYKESVRSSMTHQYGHSLLPTTPLHTMADLTSIIEFVSIVMESCIIYTHWQFPCLSDIQERICSISPLIFLELYPLSGVASCL